MIIEAVIHLCTFPWFGVDQCKASDGIVCVSGVTPSSVVEYTADWENSDYCLVCTTDTCEPSAYTPLAYCDTTDAGDTVCKTIIPNCTAPVKHYDFTPGEEVQLEVYCCNSSSCSEPASITMVWPDYTTYGE